MIQISTNLSIWLKFQTNLNSSPSKAFAMFFVQMPLLFFQKAFFKVFLTHYNSFVPELSNGSGAGLSVVDQKGLSWVSGLRIFRFYWKCFVLIIISENVYPCWNVIIQIVVIHFWALLRCTCSPPELYWTGSRIKLSEGESRIKDKLRRIRLTPVVM